MGLILWFIIGVVCFIAYDDPSKPTLEDFKDVIFGYKGVSATFFVILYIITYIAMIFFIPLLMVYEWFERRKKNVK